MYSVYGTHGSSVLWGMHYKEIAAVEVLTVRETAAAAVLTVGETAAAEVLTVGETAAAVLTVGETAAAVLTVGVGCDRDCWVLLLRVMVVIMSISYFHDSL
jgi:hypothetical protein